MHSTTMASLHTIYNIQFAICNNEMAAHSSGMNNGSAQAQPASPLVAPGSYQIDLPQAWLDEQGNMLDWVIGFAFDTLNTRHLDLRIVADLGSA